MYTRALCNHVVRERGLRRLQPPVAGVPQENVEQVRLLREVDEPREVGRLVRQDAVNALRHPLHQEELGRRELRHELGEQAVPHPTGGALGDPEVNEVEGDGEHGLGVLRRLQVAHPVCEEVVTHAALLLHPEELGGRAALQDLAGHRGPPQLHGQAERLAVLAVGREALHLRALELLLPLLQQFLGFDFSRHVVPPDEHAVARYGHHVRPGDLGIPHLGANITFTEKTYLIRVVVCGEDAVGRFNVPHFHEAVHADGEQLQVVWQYEDPHDRFRVPLPRFFRQIDRPPAAS
ncbi:uncharacterized protein BcabD6B2_30830 [Babesia caballi]|uniref:Uncharacterized protein n=1 Tax=Babesia caballi TaxID=5871 RepID=A0AAV4LV61_BABCB|nr:hypothetical protein BcabD6B2_30830 [Babesia caballi]